MRIRAGVLAVFLSMPGASVWADTSDKAGYTVKAEEVLKQFGGTSGIVEYLNSKQGSSVSSAASTFTVISQADNSDYLAGDGQCGKFQIQPPVFVLCSFRAAIEEANAHAGLDIIHFDVGAGGVQTIAPASPLPTITDPVIIDGTTQPGSAGTPIIELNGASAGINADGLVLTAAGNTVRGLIINRFSNSSGTGIYIQSDNNVIQGNFIGTDVSGTADLGNSYGIEVENSTGNTIGGTTAGNGNLISGNRFYGIFLDNSPDNDIAGNFIGTDGSGTAALGNEIGIRLLGSSSNTIGGALAGERNIISGNTSVGVYVSLGSFNRVLGNFIGTDFSGTADVGNVGAGVRMDNSSYNDIFYNVISGNDGYGVFIASPGAVRNELLGNFIGTDSGGSAALGNGVGILIASSSNNVFGGYSSKYSNTIAFNAEDGIRVSSSVSATGNFFVWSSIHSNGGLGINLYQGSVNDGVTANDSMDADSGSNHLQNFPDLSQVFGGSNSTTIAGMLNSYANAPFRIEFFSNDSCDTSGYGEGQSYIGSDTVITDGNGNAAINVTFPVPLPTGKFITATAADSARNTSEFSPCRPACMAWKGDMNGSGGLSPADVVLMLNCVFLATGSCDLCFADVNCSGNLSPADVVIELNMVFAGASPLC